MYAESLIFSADWTFFKPWDNSESTKINFTMQTYMQSDKFKFVRNEIILLF